MPALANTLNYKTKSNLRNEQSTQNQGSFLILRMRENKVEAQNSQIPVTWFPAVIVSTV